MPIEECPMLHARRDGKLVRVESDTFMCRDGRRLPVAYTASPFATEDGVEGCVVLFEDITERQARAHRVERDLEKLEWLAAHPGCAHRGAFCPSQPADRRPADGRDRATRTADPHARHGRTGRNRRADRARGVSSGRRGIRVDHRHRPLGDRSCNGDRGGRARCGTQCLRSVDQRSRPCGPRHERDPAHRCGPRGILCSRSPRPRW